MTRWYRVLAAPLITSVVTLVAKGRVEDRIGVKKHSVISNSPGDAGVTTAGVELQSLHLDTFSAHLRKWVSSGHVPLHAESP